MLPTGHVEVSWAALNLIQRKTSLFSGADYRLVALAALAPDLVDKPLALTLYRGTHAALFWGHNLWFHGAVWLLAWVLSPLYLPVQPEPRRRRAFGPGLPYLLAFSGHLVADRMWGFQESLFYPLGAGYWHPWTHVGDPAAMLDAYLHIVQTTPLLVFFEVAGLLVLAWFIYDRALWRRDGLVSFFRTGRPPACPVERTGASSVPRAGSLGWFIRRLAGRFME